MVRSAPFSEDVLACLSLYFTPRLGRVTYRRLMQAFGSPQAVFRASDGELMRIRGVSAGLVEAIRKTENRKRAEEEMRKALQQGIDLVCYHEEAYPSILKQTYNPPPVLYVRGSILPTDSRAVAVVGTRNPTRYGLNMTRKICSGLVAQGVTVVSGLARGIDGMAHRVVVELGGRTLAVLGSGMDVMYPPEHKDLFTAVTQHGAVLTEFPLGTRPDGGNFPMRNRIISGLCLGAVVVEAGARSGALITAYTALEQNREVFAVPGPVTSGRSQGPHRLIKQGAKLVEDAEDILDEIRALSEGAAGTRTLLREEAVREVPVESLSGTERRIVDFLETEPVHVDAIVRGTGLSPGDTATALLDLELKDLVECLPGNNYVRK